MPRTSFHRKDQPSYFCKKATETLIEMTLDLQSLGEALPASPYARSRPGNTRCPRSRSAFTSPRSSAASGVPCFQLLARVSPHALLSPDTITQGLLSSFYFRCLFQTYNKVTDFRVDTAPRSHGKRVYQIHVMNTSVFYT